ncbi:hypothetical protein KL925_003223 [Ogataea polymorpha]|uniref:U three protein 7 n=1 Tax=Ogataea polymorpha TaxID=460523 RepID=A0A9P8TF50_9ASCO|nr:hypothetical protein KL937_001925 [Ogataea polymorpha]KAG7889778.1 hypothetical protein KL936_002452 [Ogataea polymorpha]KAG7909692.1 hypothetical protein KL906_002448 [Ogataea polymorpha]KAG7917214.1 hypothetical protein KL927_002988 [Ogataea polymorpha]KAG7926938.1 hypothetical protein KL925_003223 [Ogataea polymorpha]
MAVYSKDKKLNANLKRLDQQHRDAVRSAKNTEILLQEDAGFLEAEGMEKTYKFVQDDIVKEVDQATANKRFELKLEEFGPYTLDYSRNGRDLLIGGKKGHVASFDWRLGKLDCEMHLNETVHAVKYLHNNQYFAVAQKKYVFIYDKTGMELHRLKQHIDSTLLDFLPYHFLLTSAGNTGFLKYHDVSTGELVAEHRTKLGPTQCMRQNPWNAVMHLGHANGQVTLWSPSMPTPLAKVLACRGPVRALAINRDGRHMVVAGADKTLKLWDIRNFKEIDSYYTPTQANTVDISDKGLVSVGWGPHITVWNFLKTHQNSPYMNHMIPASQIQTTRFVPFEDILGCGHSKGISSVIVPGAGEANFDALEVNPYETAKQRQQTEVRSLLNKLQPDMITLDPNVIGSVDKRAPSKRLTAKDLAELQPSQPGQEIEKKIKPEVKGKNSTVRKAKRKLRQNVINERAKRIERALEREKILRKQKHDFSKGIQPEKDVLEGALGRFK